MPIAEQRTQMRMPKFSRVLAGAAAAAAVVTLAGTGLAGAASSGSPQPPGPHTHAPRAVTAATLCDQLWAVVNSDGSLARAGCPNTSSKSLSTGTYQVNFPHVITNCAFVATVGR